MTDRKILTLAQAADRVGMSVETLKYWRKVGKGGPRTFKLGRRVVIAEEDLSAWVAEQRHAPEIAEAVPTFTNSAGTWPQHTPGKAFGAQFTNHFPLPPDFGEWVKIPADEYRVLLAARDALSAAPDQAAKAELLSELDRLRARIAAMGS